MDREILVQKLESLRRCLRRIEDKCPLEAEQLEDDPDLQDIIVLNLTRAVQLCVDIGAHVISNLEVSPPDTMGDTFDILSASEIIPDKLAIQLKKSVGFRNIAVHNYKQIDWNIVHAISKQHLEDFTRFAKSIDLTLRNL